ELPADLLVHTGLDSAHGDFNGVLDRARRRIAVTDDADSAAAEQWCATVVSGVENIERHPYVFSVDARVVAQHADDHRSDRLVKLEYDVTDEAVANDDIERAAVAGADRKVSTFD